MRGGPLVGRPVTNAATPPFRGTGKAAPLLRTCRPRSDEPTHEVDDTGKQVGDEVHVVRSPLVLLRDTQPCHGIHSRGAVAVCIPSLAHSKHLAFGGYPATK